MTVAPERCCLTCRYADLNQDGTVKVSVIFHVGYGDLVESLDLTKPVSVNYLHIWCQKMPNANWPMYIFSQGPCWEKRDIPAEPETPYWGNLMENLNPCATCRHTAMKDGEVLVTAMVNEDEPVIENEYRSTGKPVKRYHQYLTCLNPIISNACMVNVKTVNTCHEERIPAAPLSRPYWKDEL